ncbi:MAG: hypothetical protein AAFY17_03415 [Cyanobacteria bacterium J06642_11]
MEHQPLLELQRNSSHSHLLSLDVVSSDHFSELDADEQAAVRSLVQTLSTLAQSITDTRQQLYALTSLAQAYQAMGDSETAVTLLDTVVASLISTDELDLESRIYLQIEIAQGYVAAGRSSMAVSLLQEVLILSVPFGATDQEDRYSFILSRVVAVVATLPAQQQGFQLLTSILDVVPDIPRLTSQARLLGNIVNVVATWSDPSAQSYQAQVLSDVIAQAQAGVLMISQESISIYFDPWAEMLVQVANVAGTLPDISQAEFLLETLSMFDYGSAYPIYRVDTLNAIARAYSHLEASQKGLATLTDSVAAMQDISQISWYVERHYAAATIADQLGDFQLRDQLISQANDSLIDHVALEPDSGGVSSQTLAKMSYSVSQFQNPADTRDSS